MTRSARVVILLLIAIEGLSLVFSYYLVRWFRL